MLVLSLLSSPHPLFIHPSPWDSAAYVQGRVRHAGNTHIDTSRSMSLGWVQDQSNSQSLKAVTTPVTWTALTLQVLLTSSDGCKVIFCLWPLDPQMAAHTSEKIKIKFFIVGCLLFGYPSPKLEMRMESSDFISFENCLNCALCSRAIQ